MKLNIRTGDRFRLLKDGEDMNGLRVKKGTIMALYDLVMEKNPHPYNNFIITVKGITTDGRLLHWHLDDEYLEKIKD
jgi:hypothetical protein